MNAIELKNITKQYPEFLLDGIDLELPSGMILGLVGENGAGKTTILRILLGMLKKDGGELTVLGCHDLRNDPAVKEQIGVVMDDVNLPAFMNINEIGDLMQRFYSGWDKEVFRDLVNTLKIPENTKFSELSRGNRMKTGFAAALSHHPKLLILDEATSGLDPLVRDEILDILMEFTKQEDHSVLMSSHIVSDLEKACDYIAFLHEGKMIMTEEKDMIREKYGKVSLTEAQLAELDKEALIGTRHSPYGVEAVVRRDLVPDLPDMRPADIEELFVFMVKGER